MRSLLWFDAVLLVTAAALLVAGVGAAGLWISIIAVGIALALLLNRRGGTPAHR